MASRSNPVYCGVDTTDLAQATKLIQSIAGGARPAVGGIKLGLEFFLSHGAPGVRYAFPAPVRATGVGFFLDLKLHDIPNTVAGGLRAVVELAPTYITIHASGGRADTGWTFLQHMAKAVARARIADPAQGQNRCAFNFDRTVVAQTEHRLGRSSLTDGIGGGP